MVVYTLRKMGIQAMEAGEGLPFDVLAVHEGRTVRIQTKSTQSCKGGRFSFITARGRYAPDSRHATSLTGYTFGEADMLACSALPIEKVLFVPVARVAGTRLSFDEAAFSAPGAAAESFREGLKELHPV